MPFVVDASVTMAWCFEDEATPETEALLDRLQEDAATVPSLWELEVVNVLLVAERRNRLGEAQSARFLSLLGQLPISVDTVSDVGAVLAAGRRHNLSAYDAAYLVLAEREGLALATLDASLAAAADSAGVSLLIPV